MANSVKVGKVPGRIKEVFIDDGTTVSQVLAEAELSNEEGFSVRLNGEPVTDMDTVVYDGDSITLVREV